MSFKSSEKSATSNSTSTTTPWDVQTPFLTQAFQDASKAYGQASGATAPTNFTAQFTPDQLGAFQNMLNYGMSAQPSASAASNAGATLTNAGAGATTGGLFNLSQINPQSVADNNVAAANKYVAGQNIPATVDAAMVDARRNANENVLPALSREAAGTGNINSSRTAIAQGVVDRGLAEQAGSLSSQLRQQAYDNGLNLGQQGTNSALTAALGAVNGGNSAVGQGVNAGVGGINQQQGLFNIANGAIGNQNTAAQADLTNQLQQFQNQTNDPFAALVNFYNIIGNRPWGQTTNATGTTTQQDTPSGMAQLGGIISGVGSLASMFI
jgi:hypothetical protein